MSQRPQDRRGPIAKREFIADLRSALERGTGYAAGRLSYFGVLGKRWHAWGDWRERDFNDTWIDMPARFRPAESGVCDSGAYW
jgi:hypothetical protein